MHKKWTFYISHELQTTQNVLWSRASVCLSVSLSAAACPHYCTDPDVTWLSGRGCPLVVHYWGDLQSVQGLHCYGNIMRMWNVSEYMLVLALCLVYCCKVTAVTSSPTRHETGLLRLLDSNSIQLRIFCVVLLRMLSLSFLLNRPIFSANLQWGQAQQCLREVYRRITFYRWDGSRPFGCLRHSTKALKKWNALITMQIQFCFLSHFTWTEQWKRHFACKKSQLQETPF